jgi:hypothetical protein
MRIKKNIKHVQLIKPSDSYVEQGRKKGTNSTHSNQGKNM